MHRNYASGIIRDPIGRVLTVHYQSATAKKLVSVSAECWVANDESPIKALTTELRQCLGIPKLNVFNIKHTRILNMQPSSKHSQPNVFLNVFLLDVVEATRFRFADEVADAIFMPWQQLLSLAKTGAIVLTKYSQRIVDNAHVWSQY